MRTIVANRLLWAGIATAIFCLGATYAVNTSAKGGRCSSSPCTYIDAQGGQHTGTCGSKKGDAKNCYCFDKEDKKLSQVQSACSATTKD